MSMLGGRLKIYSLRRDGWLPPEASWKRVQGLVVESGAGPGNCGGRKPQTGCASVHSHCSFVLGGQNCGSAAVANLLSCGSASEQGFPNCGSASEQGFPSCGSASEQGLLSCALAFEPNFQSCGSASASGFPSYGAEVVPGLLSCDPAEVAGQATSGSA